MGGQTASHGAQPTGVYQVDLEKRTELCICWLISETLAFLPVPGQKNARNLDAFHWVSPQPKQTTASRARGCTYKAKAEVF